MITALEIYFISFAALLALLLLYYKNAYSYFRERGIPTLPPSFPFGNMAEVMLRKQSINDKVCEIYNFMKHQGHRCAGIYFFTKAVFLPIDVDLIKNILTKDFVHFEDRGIYYDEEDDPVSAHLFSLHGHKWKILRSKLTPAFTAGKVRYMFQTILNCGDEMAKLMIENAQKQNTVEIKDVFARYTTDVIGSCAFGIDCNSLKNPQAEFRQMGIRAFANTKSDVIRNIIINTLPAINSKFLKLSVFPKNVTNFFKTAVEDTITYRENNNVTRNDFLQLLIQMKNGEALEEDKMKNGYKIEDMSRRDKDTLEALTMNEAAAQAFIFFLAGFETTSTTLSFALFEMALNSNIQDQARNELTKALRKYDNDLTYDCIGELQYLEKVIFESLRKYPPAPVYFRKCTKDYKIPGTNTVIEKDTPTLIPTMAVHRDPEFYSNPELFDPERFSEDNRSNIKDCTYIPFGDGPRKCIGMRFAMVQSKLALALLLKNFRFSLSPKTQLPLKMEAREVVLSPAGGIWIVLEKIF